MFAKSLGNEVGRPTLVLDVGTLMGSLVGQTEERTRQALRIADAMAPCVVYVDEIDKALGGVGQSGHRPTRASVLADVRRTADLAQRPRERRVLRRHVQRHQQAAAGVRAKRAVRWDLFRRPAGCATATRAIWKLYLDKFGLDPSQPQPADADYTGAEIKACCRISALLGMSLVQAAEHVVPVARTASESVERLRTWADGRCLSADRAGVYRRNAGVEIKPGRKIRRDPQTTEASIATLFFMKGT